MQRPAILMADDDPDDCFLVRDALRTVHSTAELFCVGDGEELLDYLRRNGKYADGALCPIPDLVLLDLNMPRKDGRKALRPYPKTSSRLI